MAGVGETGLRGVMYSPRLFLFSFTLLYIKRDFHRPYLAGDYRGVQTTQTHAKQSIGGHSRSPKLDPEQLSFWKRKSDKYAAMKLGNQKKLLFNILTELESSYPLTS